ncbi:hypothetical protein BGZ68_002533, partial [Mortierella alpina]
MDLSTPPITESTSTILDSSVHRLSISPPPNDEDSVMVDATAPKSEPTGNDQDRLMNARITLQAMREDFKRTANIHMDLIMKSHTQVGSVQQAELDAYQQRIDVMKETIAAFEEALKNCQDAESPEPATETKNVVATPKKETMVVLGNDGPRVGPKNLGTGKPYNVISKAHVLLEKFHAVLSSSYGTNFKSMAHRLLIVAVLIDDTQRRLKEDLMRFLNCSG